MGEFWNIQGHWAVLKTILRKGEGEKTKSPKISQGAFADRTVSNELIFFNLNLLKPLNIKGLNLYSSCLSSSKSTII